jgi:hypothetical protein
VLPGLLLFGVGLAATVAPLTTTVLNSVDEHNAGIASGVNNAVARVAGLVAIAVLGAVMSAQFESSLDEKLAGQPLPPRAERVISDAREQTLAGAEDTEELGAVARTTVTPALEDSSHDAFAVGIIIAAALMIFGGLTSAVGVVDEKRRLRPTPAPVAATAGECGRACHAPELAPEAPERVPA